MAYDESAVQLDPVSVFMFVSFVNSLGISIAFAAAAGAQKPIPVTVCDLLNTPQNYAGKLVEVRARVSLAFEDFSLAQQGCEDAYPGVWLIYGGDVATPTASTVNDLERKPGTVMKVDGILIPLVHDQQLELFKDRLEAVHLAPIGDRPCFDCYLYRVTATLRGIFFAARHTANTFEGYGHLGCCHLLAIEQVSDLAAERTAIPFGGSFRCRQETRKLGAEEAQALRKLDRPCGKLSWSECEEINSRPIAAAARLWNESIQVADGIVGAGAIEGTRETQTWESADKLKTYSLEIDSEDPQRADSRTTGGSITREICTAAVPPLPMTAVPSCRKLWSEFPTAKAEVMRIGAQARTGKDPWRMGPAEEAAREGLNEAAGTWNVELAPNLKSKVCSKLLEYQGEQFTWCELNDPSGMQTFQIQLTRFGYLRHGRRWEEVPWVLTRGNGVVCTVEPQGCCRADPELKP